MARSPKVVSFCNLEEFESDVLLSEEGYEGPITLILLGLVIEVGRSFGAQYCLLDATKLKEPFVEVLRTHFGMKWVRRAPKEK